MAVDVGTGWLGDCEEFFMSWPPAILGYEVLIHYSESLCLLTLECSWFIYSFFLELSVIKHPV